MSDRQEARSGERGSAIAATQKPRTGRARRIPHQLRPAYRHCRRVARHSGSSFYAAFVLLGGMQRSAMDALYAFLRFTDDLVDTAEPVEQRRYRLGVWRGMFDCAVDTAQSETCDWPALLEHLRSHADRAGDAAMLSGAMILPAVAHTSHIFAIPRKALSDVFEGVSMDLPPRRFQTFDELAEYCRCVASVVGLACIHVWGFSDDRAKQLAERCGLAFQMTNILRDLAEDIGTGRCYLPLADFNACGYSPEELARGVSDERFRRLIEMQIERTRGFYREAAGLYELLDRGSRAVFAAMFEVYHALFEELARRRNELLTGRVRLPRRRKRWITLRRLVLPGRPLRVK